MVPKLLVKVETDHPLTVLGFVRSLFVKASKQGRTVGRHHTENPLEIRFDEQTFDKPEYIIHGDEESRFVYQTVIGSVKQHIVLIDLCLANTRA